MTIFIEKAWLEANDVHKWSLQFQRLDEEANTWVPFETKRVREDEERVFYTVVVPGFSTIAITGSEELAEPQFEVTVLTIEPASPASGQAVTISAQVRNIGEGDGTYPANLWVAETVETSYVIPLDAGEASTVSFTWTPRSPGDYAIRVERLLGSLTVIAPAAEESAPTPASNGVADVEGQVATPAASSDTARAGGRALPPRCHRHHRRGVCSGRRSRLRRSALSHHRCRRRHRRTPYRGRRLLVAPPPPPLTSFPP